MSDATPRRGVSGIPPELQERVVELMRELVTEALWAVFESVEDEESRQLKVEEVAERTGQTRDAVYAQIKRRESNGLEASGALLKPPGARRGWRILWGPYRRWLGGVG